MDKNDKKKIRDEIMNKDMQKKITRSLKSAGDGEKYQDAKVKFVRLLMPKPEKRPPSFTSPAQYGDTDVTNTANHSMAQANISEAEKWIYLRLRKTLHESETDEERLKNLLPLILCALDQNKEETNGLIGEMEELVKFSDIPNNEIPEILQNINKIVLRLMVRGDITKSLSLRFQTIPLIKKIQSRLERIEAKGNEIKKIVETIATMYDVKSECLKVELGEDDEQGMENSCHESSGTEYEQAKKAQNRGKIEFKRKNFEEAHQYFKLALEIAPSHADLRLDLAEVYFAEQKLEQCVEECKKGLESCDEENKCIKAKILALMGVAQLNMGKILAAFKYMEESQSLEICEDVKDKINQMNLDILLIVARAHEEARRNIMHQALSSMIIPNFSPVHLG